MCTCACVKFEACECVPKVTHVAVRITLGRHGHAKFDLQVDASHFVFMIDASLRCIGNNCMPYTHCLASSDLRTCFVSVAAQSQTAFHKVQSYGKLQTCPFIRNMCRSMPRWTLCRKVRAWLCLLVVALVVCVCSCACVGMTNFMCVPCILIMYQCNACKSAVRTALSLPCTVPHQGVW